MKVTIVCIRLRIGDNSGFPGEERKSKSTGAKKIGFFTPDGKKSKKTLEKSLNLIVSRLKICKPISVFEKDGAKK